MKVTAFVVAAALAAASVIATETPTLRALADADHAPAPVAEFSDQTGPEAPLNEDDKEWGGHGWGHHGRGWGRPGWGWGRPGWGWGRPGWGWGRPGWGHGW